MSLDPRYHIEDTSDLLSPALVVYRGLVEANIDQMVRIAGDPQRLRPHCKTHKLPEVVRIQLQKHIAKHKCATIAEAEMLAEAGVRDVFLAYNLVGPNIRRALNLVERYPDLVFYATADHPGPIAELGRVFSSAGRSMGLLLDIDTGLQRTGLRVGDEAHALYRQIADTPGLEAAGLHVYDGHNHQRSVDPRRQAVADEMSEVIPFRDDLLSCGLPVPRIVVGGTGTFPLFAELRDPTLELSPGTCVFYDAGYTAAFPDLPFDIAAMLLTRVISRPGPGRLTLDAGTKSCASDPPQAQRLVFPDLPDARIVLQNEEHLVLESSLADRYEPGVALLAFPWHICPTTALHKKVYVVQDSHVTAEWEVIARDRQLSI